MAFRIYNKGELARDLIVAGGVVVWSCACFAASCWLVREGVRILAEGC